MKHPHYDMIVAKAANTGLVVLFKDNANQWHRQIAGERGVIFTEDAVHFLCHEKHVNACLHWLNGGTAESRFADDWLELGDPAPWFPNVIFMFESNSIRIKPKKEMRWFAVETATLKTTRMYPSEEECRQKEFSGCAANEYGWQILSAEMEVE